MGQANRGVTLSQAKALHAVADELAGFIPLPDTFRGMSGVQGAKVTLRMAVELLRERADNKPDTGRPASEDELNTHAQRSPAGASTTSPDPKVNP